MAGDTLDELVVQVLRKCSPPKIVAHEIHRLVSLLPAAAQRERDEFIQTALASDIIHAAYREQAGEVQKLQAEKELLGQTVRKQAQRILNQKSSLSGMHATVHKLYANINAAPKANSNQQKQAKSGKKSQSKSKQDKSASCPGEAGVRGRSKRGMKQGKADSLGKNKTFPSFDVHMKGNDWYLNENAGARSQGQGLWQSHKPEARPPQNLVGTYSTMQPSHDYRSLDTEARFVDHKSGPSPSREIDVRPPQNVSGTDTLVQPALNHARGSLTFEGNPYSAVPALGTFQRQSYLATTEHGATAGPLANPAIPAYQSLIGFRTGNISPAVSSGNSQSVVRRGGGVSSVPQEHSADHGRRLLPLEQFQAGHKRVAQELTEGATERHKADGWTSSST